MQYEIKEDKHFQFIEEGNGEPLILLHGLFGALSNFADLLEHFKKTHKVIIPLLPLFDLSGGHVALVYALEHQDQIASLILTGSSGLFENGMGESYPKRGDYEYIKNKTQLTFYDPAVATKELVDEVFAITNNRMKVLKILSLAKSAIRHNLEHDLHKITLPTCLIWGKNDIITPPPVAEEFHRLLPNSQLFWIDKCGHAPMMEVPAEFNTHLDSFLANLKK
ncbi:MAG: alpha/beta hydrolase [Chitinophagia bacterium]|nr:alpha/beta hydrolase [Chitinophagia bacterium]